MSSILLLILLPIIISAVAVFFGVKVRNALSFLFVGGLMLLSVDSYYSTLYVELPHVLHTLFIAADTVLLFYFLQQGIKQKDKLVWSLATVQIILYSIVVFIAPTEKNYDILVDGTYNFMYLVINIVGGAIIIYALSYIESEEFSRLKKNAFIGMLFFFLAVMNFIVSTNNIEIFFLLFELTTLCSYILIRYRGDEVSVANSVRALWMNQIGGVAILIGLIVSINGAGTVYFDTVLGSANGYILAGIGFLAVAAYVKGASIPFNSWLLGAMVAPTPVSAILHSATMVKIAPFLILKISDAFTPFMSTVVTLFGAFVFMAASLLALSKDYFKEILGLSTIALLALMMALGAIGTVEARNAAIMLIMFHAAAKALLFLQAGILEKVFHLKYVQDIEGLANRSSFVLYMVIFGFAVLTLPPFGAFVGKFMAIESVAKAIASAPLNIFSLLFIAVGSVGLTLLYFKVVTKLFSKSADTVADTQTKIPFIYKYSSLFLALIIAVGVVLSFNYMSFYQVVIPIFLIAVAVILLALLKFKGVDRVKEYHCGEKDELIVSSYYFDIKENYKKEIVYTAVFLIVLTIVGGLL